MGFSVKEVYKTIQGEGRHSGRAAVLCRFTGCNLWSGFEKDRNKSICTFCDTDFVGRDGENGGLYQDDAKLADIISNVWGASKIKRYVVLTGGEPMLQVKKSLISELHKRNFEVAIETNGTYRVPDEVDWVCVSPKANTDIVQIKGSELKLVFPQSGLRPSHFEKLDFTHFYIQPMDGPDLKRNIHLAVEFCDKNPLWRLSLQTHKIIGVR